jgi:hypothetical protein
LTSQREFLEYSHFSASWCRDEDSIWTGILINCDCNMYNCKHQHSRGDEWLCSGAAHLEYIYTVGSHLTSNNSLSLGSLSMSLLTR